MLPINVKEMPFQQNSPISTFLSPHGGVTVTPWWPLSDSNEGSDKPQTKWLELALAVQCSPFWPQSSIVDFDTLVGCKKWPWFSPSLKRCWVQKKKIYFMASKPPEFMTPCHWAITICPFRLVSFILMSWGRLCTMGQSTGG